MPIYRSKSKTVAAWDVVVTDGPRRIWLRGARLGIVKKGPLNEQGTALWHEARLKNELRLNHVIPDGRMTLGQYLHETWLPIYENGVPGTYRAYSAAVKRAESLHGVRLGKLTNLDLQAHVRRLGGLGRSPNTVRLDMAVLSMALAYAVESGLLQTNPASVVKRPKERKRKVQLLALSELRELIMLTERSRHGPLTVLALTTTKRWFEMMGLTWARVDFEQRQFEVVDGKGAASEKAVPLTDMAIAALKLQKIRVERLRAKAGKLWDEHGLVFPSNRGTPLLYPAFHKEWRALVGERWPGLHFHDLRHQSITLLTTRLGVPPSVAQDLAGHASPEITMGTYTHVVPEQTRAAAEALEALLRGNG